MMFSRNKTPTPPSPLAETDDDGHLRYLLTAYLFGSISESGRREVERHLEACAACREELAELRETLGQVEDALGRDGESADADAAGETPTDAYRFEDKRRERVLAVARRASRPGRRVRRIALWSSAAAALLLIGLGLIQSMVPMMAEKDSSLAYMSQSRKGEELADASADYDSYGNSPVRPYAVEGHTAAPEADRKNRPVDFGAGHAIGTFATPLPGEAAQPAAPEPALPTQPARAARAATPPPAAAESRWESARGGGRAGKADFGDAALLATTAETAPAEEPPAETGEGEELTENITVVAGLSRDRKPASSAPTASKTRHRMRIVDFAEKDLANLSNNANGEPSEDENAVALDVAGTTGTKEVFRSYRSAEGATASLPSDGRTNRRPKASAVIEEKSYLARDPTAIRTVREALRVPAATDRRKVNKALAGKVAKGEAKADTDEIHDVDATKPGTYAGFEVASGTASGAASGAYGKKGIPNLGDVPTVGQLFAGSAGSGGGGSVSKFKGAPVGGGGVRLAGVDGVANTEDDRILITGGGVDAPKHWDGYFERFSFAEPEKQTQAFIDLPREPQDSAGVYFDGFADASPPWRKPATAHGWSFGVNASDLNGDALHDVVILNGAMSQSAEGLVLVPIDGGRQLRGVERGLRAFAHYRTLNPELTFQHFTARPLQIPPPVLGDEGLGRDGFRKKYGVNPFILTAADRLSTFGLDVATASYARAKSLLTSGKLPEPKTVRVEEFINSFPEDLHVPPPDVFAVSCEGGPSPFAPAGVDLLKITIKSRALRPGERKDAVLTIAVDTSGSMAREDTIAQVRGALKTLVASLSPSDRVAIVAFSSSAFVLLPHTSVRERERIQDAIDALTPLGGTNVEAGLDLAYRLADEALQPRALNRVVLCSDGAANIGLRGPEEILARVEHFARRGIDVSVVGFGQVGYKDDVLLKIANDGNGNYSFVSSPEEARAIFQKNLPATLQVLARDAKIQVDFDPDAVVRYRLLGYEKRDVADKDFRNDAVDAGEVGPGTTVTVLYELERRPTASGSLGLVQLRYQDTTTGRKAHTEVAFDIPAGRIARDWGETSDRFRFVTCVAELAELLRESYYARGGSFGEVLTALQSISPAAGEAPAVREVARLAQQAQALTIQKLARGVE